MLRLHSNDSRLIWGERGSWERMNNGAGNGEREGVERGGGRGGG